MHQSSVIGSSKNMAGSTKAISIINKLPASVVKTFTSLNEFMSTRVWCETLFIKYISRPKDKILKKEYCALLTCQIETAYVPVLEIAVGNCLIWTRKVTYIPNYKYIAIWIRNIHWPCHWFYMRFLKKTFDALCCKIRCIIALKNDFVITTSIFYLWNEKIIQNFNVYLCIGRWDNNWCILWLFKGHR